MDSDVPPLPTFSSKTFRKKKKPEPEQKPEIDLSQALPSTDDFRTSLLMPNLSARFSMLREQDDPASKIGKANDDSVLFPKRVSRLDLFNNRAGLPDITEVESTRAGSVPRPPFASIRTESYGSDGNDGSMLGRARPGEGNTMFGGRQKIFKIPVGAAGSVKDLSMDDGESITRQNMGGKALYESDTLPSAFQIARQREKQEQQEREMAGIDHSGGRPSKEQDRSGSPPMPRYNRNRETTSSTNSGPSQSRASTAATSIASQRSVYDASGPGPPPGSASSDRHFPKGKKLYGQGLEHHHLEQQSSSLQRINSLNRQRAGVGRALPQSRSATNLNDRFQKAGPVSTSNGANTASPSPSPTPPRMQEFDLGLPNESPPPVNQVDSGYGKSPTISPPMSPSMDPIHADATLVAALEPNDLGKATASGAFNKPAKQYDDQQYLQRQLQLQEGRNSPSPVLVRPFSPPNQPNGDQKAGRSRNNSQGSQFSRTGSMRHAWEHHMEDRVLRPVLERAMTPTTQSSLRNEGEDPGSAVGERTFFGGMSGSELGSNPESESEADPNSPILGGGRSQGFRQPGPPPVSQTKPKPAKEDFQFDLNGQRLSGPTEETASDSRSHKSEATITQQVQNGMKPNEPPQIVYQNSDSPTLAPAGVENGLSGMVHQHLRNVSNTSSVYPEDSPRRSRPEVRESIFGHESALNQQEMQSPESLQGAQWRHADRQSDQSIPPVPHPLSFSARQFLEQATALKHQDSRKAMQVLANDKAQRVLGGEAPRPSHEAAQPWQEQLRAHHARGGSTETQMERESLANELEARKRIVRNNLQTFAEVESRDSSPARNRESSPNPSFGFLKKANSASPAGRQEKSTKAMKMLGLDANAETDQAPQDLFMGREQYPDRAIPPTQRVLKPLPRDMRQQQSDDSPTKSKRSFFGSRSRSPHPSKSSSDSSERRPHSRKGSAGKIQLPRGDSDSFDQTEPLPSSHMRTMPYTGQQPSDVPRTPGVPLEVSNRMRSNSKPSPPGNGPTSTSNEQRVAPPGTPVMMNPSTRSGTTTFQPPTAHSQFPTQGSHPQFSTTHPTMINPHSSPSHSNPHPSSRHGPGSRKASINKQDISEPTFLSTTSTFDTVDLPPGASLSNGMDEVHPPFSVPAIPVRDSRRKRGPNLFHAFSSRSERRPESPSISSPVEPNGYPNEDGLGFGEPRVNSGERERGSRPGTPGGINNPFRQGGVNGVNGHGPMKLAAAGQPGPASPPAMHRPTQKGNGIPPASPQQYLPYQAKPDVPASAVMF